MEGKGLIPWSFVEIGPGFNKSQHERMTAFLYKHQGVLAKKEH